MKTIEGHIGTIPLHAAEGRTYSQVEHEDLRAWQEQREGLLEACKAALNLPEICEEIGYAGEHDCFRDGHAMIKTSDGEYVRMHCQGGFPARDRIVAMLRTAVAQAEDRHD